MTLLSICTNALNELGELETPSSFAGNTNKTAKNIVRLANSEIADLSRRYDWQVLMTDQSISTVAGQEEYALPSDYSRYAVDAYNDRSNRRSIYGPITASEYQALKRDQVQSGIYKYFRIRGNQILIYPLPSATGDLLVFEYVKNTPVESAGGAPQQYFLADTDVSLIDEYLVTLGVIWRFRRMQGLNYDEEMSRYQTEVTKAVARDKALPNLYLGSTSVRYPGYNLPDQNYGA